MLFTWWERKLIAPNFLYTFRIVKFMFLHGERHLIFSHLQQQTNTFSSIDAGHKLLPNQKEKNRWNTAKRIFSGIVVIIKYLQWFYFGKGFSISHRLRLFQTKPPWIEDIYIENILWFFILYALSDKKLNVLNRDNPPVGNSYLKHDVYVQCKYRLLGYFNFFSNFLFCLWRCQPYKRFLSLNPVLTNDYMALNVQTESHFNFACIFLVLWLLLAMLWAVITKISQVSIDHRFFVYSNRFTNVSTVGNLMKKKKNTICNISNLNWFFISKTRKVFHFSQLDITLS